MNSYPFTLASHASLSLAEPISDTVVQNAGFVTVPSFCVMLIGSEDTESYSFPFISSQNIVTDVVPAGIVISTSFPSFPMEYFQPSSNATLYLISASVSTAFI